MNPEGNLAQKDDDQIFFIAGMFVAVRPPMLVELAGVSRVARIFGLMNIGDGLGNLAGLPLLGKYVLFLRRVNSYNSLNRIRCLSLSLAQFLGSWVV